MKKSLLVLVLLMSGFHLEAKTLKDCDNITEDDAAYSRCLDTVKASTDRELQTWVNNQTFILEELALKTGRSGALKMFKRTQTNFISFRENNCRWQYLAMSPDPSASSVFKRCYIEMSRTRINELSQLNP